MKKFLIFTVLVLSGCYVNPYDRTISSHAREYTIEPQYAVSPHINPREPKLQPNPDKKTKETSKLNKRHVNRLKEKEIQRNKQQKVQKNNKNRSKSSRSIKQKQYRNIKNSAEQKFSLINSDKNNEISYNEFKKHHTSQKNNISVKKTFNQIDKNRDNKISLEEFRAYENKAKPISNKKTSSSRRSNQ